MKPFMPPLKSLSVHNCSIIFLLLQTPSQSQTPSQDQLLVTEPRMCATLQSQVEDKPSCFSSSFCMTTVLPCTQQEAPMPCQRTTGRDSLECPDPILVCETINRTAMRRNGFLREARHAESIYLRSRFTSRMTRESDFLFEVQAESLMTV